MSTYPLSGADVSATVRQTLLEHLPAQLAASPRPLPAPTSYEQVPTEEAIRRVHGSTLAVINRGTSGSPERRADGSFDLTWTVAVVVWHQQTPALPLQTAGQDYAAAIRWTLTRHCPALAASVEYGGESHDLVGDGLTDQTLGMSIVEFTVRTGDALTYDGPADGPLVLTTEVIHNP